MSQFKDGPDVSLKADSASSPAFRVVGVSSQSGAGFAGIHTTVTSLIIGISRENASATGEAWPVRIYGSAKVECGASVSAGSLVIPQTDTGKVVAGADTYDTGTTAVPRSVGIALENGSTNAIIEVLIMPNNIRKQAFA